MKVHMICVHPFAQYTKGQLITDQELIKKLREHRDHYFVKVAAPADPVDESTAEETSEV